MAEKERYVLLCDTVYELEKRADLYIKRGYVPAGGVAIGRDGALLFQAMVLKEALK